MTRPPGSGVIIVVEDSVRTYSIFLSQLYVELLKQASSMIAEGVNELHKRMRMRARPKVLLATSYEEAVERLAEYRHNALGLITDIRFHRDGVEDPRAGFVLVEHARKVHPTLPILIQSSEPDAKPQAELLKVAFSNKNSAEFLENLSRFLRQDLGFGDFVFRQPDGSELGSVRDMYEMERMLPEIPDESVIYNGEHNHFSTWLMARGMFMLARELRRRRVEEFSSAQALRTHLISVLRRARRQEHLGAITDLRTSEAHDQTFIRLGAGSIGGKGRAIAFVNSIQRPQRLHHRFEGLEVRVPKSVAIGTEEFEQFLDNNKLQGIIWEPQDNTALQALFQRAQFSESLQRRIQIACSDMHAPLAVRSSSILEDSRQRPFAGVYATYMLPNNHPDPRVRIEELIKAVKAVYASTYSQSARAYMDNTPHRIEEERMAVVIQEVIGRRYGDRYYPHIGGVAYSYNYYPVAGQQAEEGSVSLSLGLGKMVVDGGASVRFSPHQPHILPQFTTASDYLSVGQSQFYAVDLSSPITNFTEGESAVSLYNLPDAERDGTLMPVGSVYCPDDDIIRDNLRLAGPRVVTFNNILKWNSIPLAEALETLLGIMREGFGQAVELEFAVDLPKPGADERPVLYVLQVRPQVTAHASSGPKVPDLSPDAFLCKTEVSLGHGIIDNLRDVIHVKPKLKEHGSVQQAAQEVGELDALLRKAGRPYMLIGPGRWGSSDPRLGIPVEWAQISGAKVIIETTFDGRPIEPSQGSHFFHNVLSMQLGYLTLSMAEQQLQGQVCELDTEWLAQQPSANDRPLVRHIELDDPVMVYLDGREGRASILKPGMVPDGD